MRAIGTGKVKALIIFLLPLLVSGISFGLKACQCNPMTIEFSFVNNYDSLQHYTIQKGGAAATWGPIVPTTFTIAPGEVMSVMAFITIPCDTAPGDYDLELLAVSEGGVVTESKTLSVSTCHSFDVMPSYLSYQVCVDKELIIPINVTNSGNFTESIDLAASAGELTDNSVIIDSGEIAEVNLSITYDELKETSVIIRVFNTNYESSKTFTIDSVECSFFKATLDKDYLALCENEDEHVTLKLTNLDDSLRIVYMSVDSPFIGVPSQVDLGPNEVKDVRIQVHSTCDTQILTSDIVLYAPGSERKILPLTLNFRSCYKPIVASPVETDNICSCENTNYKFKIYNPGSKGVVYSLSASRGWISLDNATPINEVQLGPDGSAELIVNSLIECDEVGSIPITLKATGVNVCNKSSQDTISLDVKSWGGCEAVDVSSLDTVIFNESEQIVVPVSINNVGRRSASYNIEVSGNALPYLLGISTGFITLNPGESEIVELTLKPHNFSESNIIVTALSLDNLATDSKIISLINSEYAFTFDFYYLVIPVAVVALMLIIYFRTRNGGKENDDSTTKGLPKIKRAEIKK